MTVAPVALANLLRSFLSILLKPMILFFTRYFEAISSMALVVKITFAPALIISSNLSFKISYSRYLIFSKLLGSLTWTWMPMANLNLLRLKSRQAIFAFSISVGIYWLTLLILVTYPSKYSLSILHYPWDLTICTLLTGYFPEDVFTLNMAFTHISEKSLLSPEINFELIQVLATLINPDWPNSSTLILIWSFINAIAYLQAVLYPLMITLGWICLWII